MQKFYSEHIGNIQLKIESKKLHSGKCQVKFYVTGERIKNMYGYTLVDSDRTLKEVVKEIRERVSSIKEINNYYQKNLFSIMKRDNDIWHNFMVFKN